ncbi:hypothetical protein [Jiangella alkaliphila]|uniref:Secreted protein n=1 Tax=Jiangella alkaliphila TaxID=419479 RepID=A0A1H2J956_9ACTN|nr:hypothetical protein [Jiangella alkaliphila]SDU52721.1 hypothetical protein SAMN04488563_2423 [Jiangella alkaliphila]
MLTTHSRARRRTMGRLAGAAFAAGLTATTLFAASGPAQATPAPATAAMAYDHTYVALNLDKCQHVRRQYSSWAWVSTCYPYVDSTGGYWAFDWTCRVC